jgi:LysR family hydrogen peroxide-inducible transcriptional activator
MTLTQLEYALAVREHATMSRAAEACHVSQPSLSQGLKKLEESLGVTLFERSSSGAEPTPAGEAILDRAERVMEAVHRLEETAAAASRSLFERDMRLGVIRTLGPYLLPRILPAIERRYPDFDLEVTEGLTDELLGALTAHELDAVLLALPWPISDELAVVECFDEELFVGVPPDDPLAEDDRIRLDAIDPDDLLLLDEGHCLRDHTLEACNVEPAGTRKTFRGASLETMRAFVESGWGVGLFPALTLRPDCEMTIRPPTSETSRTVALAVRRSFPHRRAIRELADDVAELVGDDARQPPEPISFQA